MRSEKRLKKQRKTAKLTVPSEVLSKEPEVFMKKINKQKAPKSASIPAKHKEELTPKNSIDCGI